MAKYEAALGKEGMEAVLRIRDRIAGKEGGKRDVYMCHGFCELGALRLVPVLRDMRDFLVANPGEVIIIVIQDESVKPQDIERCFKESGLVDFVYRGAAKPPWPTLRQMVETDQRVLVMAENNSEGVPWYHPAFEVLQETPYGFKDPSEFSNRPNRGGTGGSLLLMNHWIESVPSPKPSDAAIVNAHDALMKRIRAFQRERGRLPNLVAVDFYGTGDLIAVARELNEAPRSRLLAAEQEAHADARRPVEVGRVHELHAGRELAERLHLRAEHELDAQWCAHGEEEVFLVVERQRDVAAGPEVPGQLAVAALELLLDHPLVQRCVEEIAAPGDAQGHVVHPRAQAGVAGIAEHGADRGLGSGGRGHARRQQGGREEDADSSH